MDDLAPAARTERAGALLATGRAVELMAHVLSTLVRDPGGAYRLTNGRNRRVLADHVLRAFESKSRRRGLLHHASLPRGTAMIIAPTSAIHTCFMRFAIDIAFIDRGGRVMKVCTGVRPWRIAIAPGAFAAIEMPAGTLAASETVAGDDVVVVPVSA